MVYATYHGESIFFGRFLQLLDSNSKTGSGVSWVDARPLMANSCHESLPAINTFVLYPTSKGCRSAIEKACKFINSNPQGVEAVEWSCSRDVELLRSGEIVVDDPNDSSSTDQIFQYRQVPASTELGAVQKHPFDKVDLARAWRVVKNLKPPRRDVTVTVLSTGAPASYSYLRGEVVRTYNSVGGTNVVDEHGHGSAMFSIVDGVCNNQEFTEWSNARVKLIPIKVDTGETGSAKLSNLVRGLNEIVQIGGADVVIIPYVAESDEHLDFLLKKVTWKLSGATVVVPSADANMGLSSHLITPCHLALNRLGMLCVASTWNEDPTKLYSNSKYDYYIHLGMPSSDVATGIVKDGYYSHVRFRGGGAAAALIGGVAALLSSIGTTKQLPYNITKVLIDESWRSVMDKRGQPTDINVTDVGRAVEKWSRLALQGELGQIEVSPHELNLDENGIAYTDF